MQNSMENFIPKYLLKKSILFLLVPVLLFAAYDLIFPFKIEACWSPVIRDRKGEWMGAYLSCDDKWRIYPSTYEELHSLQKLILHKEDKYFYYHPGVNVVSIFRALYQNILKGQIHSGASTITMQLARMLNRRKRTYAAKFLEMLRALQLEIHYSKDEILQAYLSLLPYGGNVEGVSAASRLFFQSDPSRLSLSRQVLLCVIPNDPNRLNPARSDSRLEKIRNQWLHHFYQESIISRDEMQTALAEPIAFTRILPENPAPHFSNRVKHKSDPSGTVETTLDLSLQNTVQAIADSHIRRWSMAGIQQYAVMVVRNDSGDVLAYLGSSGFSDYLKQGQVDGLTALRSPGSTLKPLAYAMAIDQGTITPGTMLPDIPLDFGGYQPENFDKVFHGKVTATFALAHSLNLPAVYLLEKNGIYPFIDKLISIGFKGIQKQRKGLGLSTVLGGCGVTGEELIRLYMALAGSGRGMRPRFLKTDLLDTLPSVCSAQAAWMITEILTRHTRPDLPNGFQNSRDIPRIAWKTGTSYGRRDAWSVGYNRDITILVWMGNFDGSPSPYLSGADVATPLLFDIAKWITRNGQYSGWMNKPSGIEVRAVCPESGLSPQDVCPYSIQDIYLPGISDMHRCRHLKRVRVSSDKKMSFCEQCLPQSGFVDAWYPDIPPEMAEWMRTSGIQREKPPLHNPACSRALVSEKLNILTPANGKTYLLEKGNENGIPFRCLAPEDATTLFWYLNGKFIGKSAPEATFFHTPPVGNGLIQCTDDKGRTGKSSFRFETY